MDTNRYKTLKVLSSLGLAGLLLLSMALSLSLAQGPFTQTRVTTSSDGANRGSGLPSLNADGTKVAFQSDSDFLNQGIAQFHNEIWLFDTTTMTLTRITTSSGANRGSFGPSMSANETTVAFSSDSDFLGQGIADGQNEIWLFDTATMTLTRVTTSSDGNKRDSVIASLNADGTRVAFQSDSDFLGQGIVDEQHEIWLFDTVTPTLTRVTTSSDGANRSSRAPSLSADGTKVAFASTSDFLGQGIPQGQNEIWLFDTTTMTLTRVTTSGTNRNNEFPSLSADGSKVAFFGDADFLGQSIPQDHHEIWLFDTATMTLTRITTSGTNRFSQFPSLSADGTKVAFHSDADFLNQGIPSFQFEIWLFDTSTMTVTRVTTSGLNRDSVYPNLNANGSKVAFESTADFLGQGIPQGQNEIWLFESDQADLYLPIILKN